MSPELEIPAIEISPDSVADTGYEQSFFPKDAAAQLDANRPRFVPLSTQVAGHDGVLSDENGFVIIKPCTDTEIAFYEKCLKDVPVLLDCIPAFMGTLELNTPESLASLTPEIAAQIPADLVDKLDPAYSPPNNVYERAVVLENLAYGYSKPCILDLKLGSLLCGPDATNEKRARLEKVSSSTTSGSLGVRVTGMRVWNAATNAFVDHERKWGKTLNRRTIYEHGILGYFKSQIRREQKQLIASRFLEDITRIINTLDDVELRVYSPSLLFVYEGDQGALDLAIEAEGKQLIRDELGNGIVDDMISHTSASDADLPSDADSLSSSDEARDFCICRMIDFAHAEFTPGQGRDDNILNGLKSAKKLLETYLGTEYFN